MRAGDTNLVPTILTQSSLGNTKRSDTDLSNPGANPKICFDCNILIPTKISIKRLGGVLLIKAAAEAMEHTNILIGTNMLVAMWCDVYVGPSENPLPVGYFHNLEPDSGYFYPQADETNAIAFFTRTYYWRPDGDGIASIPGLAQWIWTHEGSVSPTNSYHVEMNLTAFQTDSVDVRRLWNPSSARYYSVLWTRKLRATIR
jgi:hypothetical protein